MGTHWLTYGTSKPRDPGETFRWSVARRRPRADVHGDDDQRYRAQDQDDAHDRDCGVAVLAVPAAPQQPDARGAITDGEGEQDGDGHGLGR